MKNKKLETKKLETKKKNLETIAALLTWISLSWTVVILLVGGRAPSLDTVLWVASAGLLFGGLIALDIWRNAKSRRDPVSPDRLTPTARLDSFAAPRPPSYPGVWG